MLLNYDLEAKLERSTGALRCSMSSHCQHKWNISNGRNPVGPPKWSWGGFCFKHSYFLSMSYKSEKGPKIER